VACRLQEGSYCLNRVIGDACLASHDETEIHLKGELFVSEDAYDE